MKKPNKTEADFIRQHTDFDNRSKALCVNLEVWRKFKVASKKLAVQTRKTYFALLEAELKIIELGEESDLISKN